MIESIFVKQYAIAKHKQAPLLQEREAYLHYLAARGKCQPQLQNISMELLHVIRVLGVENFRKVDEAEIRLALRRFGAVLPLKIGKFSRLPRAREDGAGLKTKARKGMDHELPREGLIAISMTHISIPTWMRLADEDGSPPITLQWNEKNGEQPHP